MDYTEMLFAAQVRELAKALKTGELQGYAGSLPDSVPLDELKLLRTQWSREHPLADYIPVALSELKQVAAQIRSLA